MEFERKAAVSNTNKKKKLSEQVSHIIRKQILTSHLKAGAHLNEAALSEQLGVSRSPVREAINIIENEGLIETLSTGRTIVVGFTLRDLTNLYDLRLTLEWKAVESLHEKGILSFEQTGEIERILTLMERKNLTREEMQYLDTIFHRRLVEASKNRPLIRVWNTMIQTFMTLQDITNEQKNEQFLEHLADIHRMIFTSIKQGTAEKTYQLFSKHVKDGLEIVSEVLEKNLTQRIVEEQDSLLIIM